MARTLQGDIRTRILDAARDRMNHYGFKKTTIDEVAADAGVGKGTVYLYFESKEDLALAIMAHFKEVHVERMRDIARGTSRSIESKLTEMLAFQIMQAHEACRLNPGSVDLILSMKPHVQMRLRPYIEQEIAVLAEVLEQGNQQGLLDVADAMATARSLKYMMSGFWPPYPCVADVNRIEQEIASIVDLAIHGMQKCATEK